MASKRAKTIETAWLEAGMEISGDVNFVKKGWKTFVVSFRYKANAQQLSVRKEMVKIASDAGCYLFLDFEKSGRWQDGTAMFVNRGELDEWEQLVEEKLEALRRTFGYLQEQETALSVANLMLTARTYLNASLDAAEHKSAFSSNKLELQYHLAELSKILKKGEYGKEVNLYNETMYGVLADTLMRQRYQK